MEYIVSIIYGIIQGITEFLPVSSSGHLALLPHFLGVSDPGVFFDLSMHLGTAFAVTLYFRDQIWTLLSTAVSLLAPSEWKQMDEDKAFVANMAISTILTFIFVLLFKPIQGDWIREPKIVAINLVLFGLLMFLADRYAPQNAPSLKSKLCWWRAAVIGISQAFAIFPGVSRSGATLTAARMSGLSRAQAGEYSFILSLPIIFGGFLIELWGHRHDTLVFDYHQMIVGLLVSFIFGLITIHFFLKLIARIGLMPFFIYRLIFAMVVYKILV